MKINYIPKNNLEKFGREIYYLLVDNFPSTFFVGGTVRDILLKQKVTDIDIATSARPEAIAEILKKHFIDINLGFVNLGIVIAINENNTVTIATFRKESYGSSRYPKITYVKNAKFDSERRDFTINSLYLSLKNNKITDYYSGINDLKNKTIKFIGEPKIRVKEDPLRIIRALRFCLHYNFKISKESFYAIKNQFELIGHLTKSKIASEINKIKNDSHKKIVLKVLNDKKNLDKYFKTR